MKNTTLFLFLLLSVPCLGQNYQWAKGLGAGSSDIGRSIAVDDSGNVYVAGDFTDLVDFDPGSGNVTLYAGGGVSDGFVAKYNKDGDYLWAFQIGAMNVADVVYGLALDDSANVYVTGYFKGTVDFDPGAGTVNLTAAGSNEDIFFAKYSSVGTYIWANKIGSLQGDFGYSIATGDSDNVYIIGTFNGTSDFDPGAGTFNLIAVGGTDIFFAKYDANGIYQWAKSIGSTFTDYGYSIVVDGSDNIYITGFFMGTADFDPGAGTTNLIAMGSRDIFFAKYNSNGIYLWAKNIGKASYNYGKSITVDGSGNLYITGYFNDTTDFDPGAGTVNLTTVGNRDIFFAKFDTNGICQWAKSIGSANNDEGNNIIVDDSGNVYITGYFSDTADFDPDTGTAIHIPNSGADIFFSKYSASGAYRWTKSIGDTNGDQGNSLEVDSLGNVYLTGSFQLTADFNPSPDTANLTSNGGTDIFFAKYSPPCLPTYTDTIALILHDGINCIDYPIVKIGSQWWMKENVNNIRYADGSLLVDGTGVGDITGNYTTKYYFNYNDTVAYSDTYGKLYTWAAAMNGAASSDSIPSGVQGVCPTGWHLPSDAEWKKLEMGLGMSQASADSFGWRGTDEGGKLKEIDTSHWQSPNTGANNSSSFTALPGGYRNTGSSFSEVGKVSIWWTSLESIATDAWSHSLRNTKARVFRSTDSKAFGWSCRCVKDIILPLTASISTVINVTCNGGTNGSATGTATGGTPPYDYSWTGGQTDSVATGLAAGIYFVTVTDANTSTAMDSVTITEPPVISITTFNPTFISCNGNSDGALNPNYTGGTPPYTYLWNDSTQTNSRSSLQAGTYTVTVTDANNCTFNDYMVLPDPPLLTVSTNPSDVSCYGGNDGTITAVPTGGAPPYAYNWSNGQTGNTATGLIANTYSVIVNDTNGCSVLAYDTVNEPSFLMVQGTSVTGVSCYGGSDGAIDITVTGGLTPYTFLWSTGYTGEDIAAIDTGWYDVTVTDANGCTTGAGNQVNQPAQIMLTISSSDITCSGYCNGSATVIATGGVQPYTFLWTNGETSSTATGLCSASHQVTLTDLNGCVFIDSLILYDPMPISYSDITIAETCNDSNGSAAISAVGGNPPYSYNWSNGYTTDIVNGIPGGTYIVTISDNLGCSISGVIPVDSFPPPSVNISFVNPSCYSSTDGSANAVVTGGTVPYTYLWSNGASAGSAPGLPAGIYSVTVTDTNACTGIQTITLTEPAQITVTANATDVTTCGGSNGTITVTATGGSGTLQYSNNGGATFQSSNIFSGLVAGNYNIIVNDVNGCAEQESVIINGYEGNITIMDLLAPISCNGKSDGYAGIYPSGGTPPYTYLWGNGASTDGLVNIPAGNYPVTVTDANGCELRDTIIMNEPTAVTVAFPNITAPTCGLSDGWAYAFASGGNPPYEFIWSNNDTLATADNLGAGIHSVIVVDENGCIAYGTLSLSSSNGPSISFTKTDNNCSGEQNGAINLTVTGGNPPYSYLWNTGEETQGLASLQAGIYEVVVTASDSCIATASIEITAPQELTVEVTKEDASCRIPDGSASLTVNGGTPPYSYQWNNGATSASLSGQMAGVYFVAVWDNNGCSLSKAVTINDIGGPEIEVLSMSSAGCGAGTSGAIDIGVIGGSGGYSFLWSDSSATQNVSGLSEGEYFVTVTDSAGCASVENVLVETAMPATQPLCVITVDSISGKNLIVWDKTLASPDIQEFRIYKEGTAAGVYNFLASVPYGSSNEYTDLAANPLQRSWRYKIKAVDSCGNESEYSDVHKTMHLAVNLGLGGKINLIWDPYEGYNYTTFIIRRGISSTQLDSLDAIPSTLHSYTDLNPPQSPMLYYVVEAVHPTGCTVLQKVKKYNASKSNTSSLEVPIGMNELQVGGYGLRVYPNPNNGSFVVELTPTKYEQILRKYELRIINVLSEVVYVNVFPYSYIRTDNHRYSFFVDLPKGIYFIKLSDDAGGLWVDKIVVQ